MKIEELIVQYFYTNKEVRLPGIGAFKLASDVTLPSEREKELTLPENAIVYEYDTRAVEDNGLIHYIVEYTGKILPLATSDLDSYIILAKQYLNIGKPLQIEGLGTLIKSQSEEYQFVQASHTHHNHETAYQPLREKTEEKISFASGAKRGRAKEKKRGLWIVIAVILLLCLAAAAWFVVAKR